MQGNNKKEYIGPEKPEDLLTCTAFLARDLVAQYLALGIITKTEAVALYIASGVIEFGRKGGEFWERPGTISKALGIPNRDVKTYIKRLIEDEVVCREVKKGDPEKKRVWIIPSLEKIVKENADAVNSEGGTHSTPQGGQPVAPRGTPSTPQRGTHCPLHLNESDLELKNEVKQIEVKVGASPQKPPEPNLLNTSNSFKNEAEEKSLNGFESSIDSVLPKDLYDPKGLIRFYRQTLTEIGRKLPPKHSTALDLKVAGAMLEVLPRGLESPEVFAESIRAYLAQVPADDPHGHLLSHLSAWLESGGADKTVLAHESAMQEAKKAQEAEAEAMYRKRTLDVIHSSPSATKIMDAIVDAHGVEAFWDDQGIYLSLEYMASATTAEDADEIIKYINGEELEFVSNSIFKACYAITKRKNGVA